MTFQQILIIAHVLFVRHPTLADVSCVHYVHYEAVRTVILHSANVNIEVMYFYYKLNTFQIHFVIFSVSSSQNSI